ncbi:MAG TPA: hypothetical protein VMH83_15040 [Candidatus Acidoferrum sp.]|nr:hypothetical protein [Candidatus Acidoferrum sp.]
MPRKQLNADLGQVECPTCHADVPFRKDKRGRFYPVCKTCTAAPNEYVLSKGRFAGADGTIPAKVATPLATPGAGEPVPSRDEIVIAPRPVPAKVKAQTKTEKTANSSGKTESDQHNPPTRTTQAPDPEVPGPGRGLMHHVMRTNRDLDDWWHRDSKKESDDE